MNLHPYQSAALDELRYAFANGLKRILLYSPTGSGKTEMAIEMIRGAINKGRGVLFLCHRLELVVQASRRLHAAGIDHGIMQGENTCRLHERVLVGSIQTIAKRHVPRQVSFIVVDEAHWCAASRAYLALFRQLSALPVIGLSATPFSKGLGKHYDELHGALFEEIIVAATIQSLIAKDYLVDVDIYAPSEPDLAGVEIVAGDYNEKQLNVAVDKAPLIGDIVIHWRRLANWKRTVGFATSIAHSKHIVAQFLAAGIFAEHLDCYTDDLERRAVLRRLEAGETLVVSNVGILAEGWDCPSVETMILARPTRSLIRYIQMAGRVLRPAPGKDRALILDHSGTCKRLGFPTDDLPLELDDGEPRKSGMACERKDPLPKDCPRCHYLKPARVHRCPQCGFAPEKQSDVEVQDGHLVQVKRAAKGKIATADQERVYSELLGYARDRGYQAGWAYYAAKALFGSAPPHRSNPTKPSADTMKLIRHLRIRRAKARELSHAR